MASFVEEKVSPTLSCNNNTNIVVYVDSDFWFTLYIMGPLFFLRTFLEFMIKSGNMKCTQ